MPVVPTEAMLAAARDALPELPAERAARYERDWGLAPDPARLLAYEPQWGTTSRRSPARARTAAWPPTG